MCFQRKFLEEEEMNITVIDPKDISDPELTAMLMSFYSRSSLPIQERLLSLGGSEEKIKESLKKYYLGYGHSSIGDCGDASCFIEGVSFLAAKALESSSLFNGQESSSRYINFERNGFYDPFQSSVSKTLLKNWLEFYSSIQGPIKKFLYQEFPLEEDQRLSVYESAVTAKCFDITRSLLPAGMKTQLGLKMSFRSLREHLNKLRFHPLEEVVLIANQLMEKLSNQFPSSFENVINEKQRAIDDYTRTFSEKEFYLLKTSPPFFQKIITITDNINPSVLDKEYSILANRPKGAALPSYLASYGTMNIQFSIDYGSWRDLQRHRNTLSNKCSPLSSMLNFNDAYFNCLPNLLKSKINDFIADQYELIFSFKKSEIYTATDFYNLQYLLPLGNMVNCELVLTLPELFYILELRSSPSVHFTLRHWVQEVWNNLKGKYSVITNYITDEDSSSSDFYYQRGNQTIHYQEGN